MSAEPFEIDKAHFEATCTGCGARWKGVGSGVRESARKHSERYGHAVHVITTTTVGIAKPS